jgi:cell division protein FtsL
LAKAVAGPTNKKHEKGKSSKSAEKQIDVNVFDKFPEKYLLLAIQQVAELMSLVMGVSATRVFAVRKERQDKGKLTPGKKI